VAKLTAEQKIATLCGMVMNGGSLRSAIKATFGDGRSYHACITRNPAFRTAVSAAMETRADLLADEILEIADSDPDPNRAKNRIDSRKWLAAKQRPKTYGERIDLNVQHDISALAAMEAARGRVLQGRVELATMDAEIVDQPELASYPDIFS